MFLPHLNAGTAPAPVMPDFVPGFDDIETAPPVDVVPEREPAPDFLPGFDDIETQPEPVKPYSGRGFGIIRPKYTLSRTARGSPGSLIYWTNSENITKRCRRERSTQSKASTQQTFQRG